MPTDQAANRLPGRRHAGRKQGGGRDPTAQQRLAEAGTRRAGQELSDLDLLGFATLDCRVRHRSGDWLRMASTMTSHQGSIVLLCEVLHRK